MVQRTVAGLGTWVVLDTDDSGFAEPDHKVDRFRATLTSFQESKIKRGKQKPYLVLVHGWAAGNAYFMLNLDALSEYFHVFAVELVGCGRSDRVAWTAQTPVDAVYTMSSALEQWRLEVGIKKMVLLGECDTTLCMWLRHEYPHVFACCGRCGR